MLSEIFNHLEHFGYTKIYKLIEIAIFHTRIYQCKDYFDNPK